MEGVQEWRWERQIEGIRKKYGKEMGEEERSTNKVKKRKRKNIEKNYIVASYHVFDLYVPLYSPAKYS
jgi:hypothetical protein